MYESLVFHTWVGYIHDTYTITSSTLGGVVAKDVLQCNIFSKIMVHEFDVIQVL